MLKYIYEKFFQRFVIEDIAECFDSFEKQHKDILTNHCRCTKREYTYTTTMAQNQNSIDTGIGDELRQSQKYNWELKNRFPNLYSGQSVATGGSIRTDNSFVQPQHYSCGNCGKPITEKSNKENT